MRYRLNELALKEFLRLGAVLNRMTRAVKNHSRGYLAIVAGRRTTPRELRIEIARMVAAERLRNSQRRATAALPARVTAV